MGELTDKGENASPRPMGGGTPVFRAEPVAPGLHFVATPIGAARDITLRALDVLAGADVIAAEDTRHTGKLLQHFQIATPQTSYHTHNWRKRLPELCDRLQAGDDVALVSDAGMPGISDPGYELVEACAVAGIRVVAIPGATAAITALCVSGLPPQPFVFEGFLPPKGRDRRDHLEQLAAEHRTLVLYEAPHRLLTTLQDLHTVIEGSRSIAVTRELTKQFEEVWRGTLATAIAHFTATAPKGEFTLVLAGKAVEPARPLSTAEIEQRLTALITAGLSRSQASRQLAQETPHTKRELYQIAIGLPDPPPA